MTKKTAEKNVVEIKEVSYDVFGFLGDKEKYTPAIFKEKKVPKAKQYTIDIEPMSDADCVAIKTLNRQEITSFQLWLADNKDSSKANDKWIKSLTDTKIKLTEKEMILITEMIQKRESLKNNTAKFEIVQKYISNLSKPHPKAADGVIDTMAWERMPKAIKADIYNRIYDISMMNDADAINLQ